MMNRSEFKDVIIEEIRRQFSEGYTVDVREVVKSNDVTNTGITVTKIGSNVGATVYVENLYERYRDLSSPELIAEELKKSFIQESALEAEVPEFDKSFILDHVYYRMANTDTNQRRLADVPVQDVPGIEGVTLYPVIEVSIGNRRGTTIIHNDSLANLDISMDELHDAAMRNTEARIEIIPLADKLRGMVPEGMMEGFESPFLVASDRFSEQGGASAFAAPGAFAKLTESYYIIPSSVHEILLLPVSFESDQDRLKSLVKEVNSDVLAPEDVLSDKIYLVEDGKFSTLEGPEAEASNEYENE